MVSLAYKVNFYGQTTSSFLHQMGTDRLWVTWFVDGSRVRRRLEGEAKIRRVRAQKPPLIEVGGDNAPREADVLAALDGVDATIEIPADINAVQGHDPEMAARWRSSTRRAFTEALACGFLVEDFVLRSRGEQSVGVYLLSRGRSAEDFA